MGTYSEKDKQRTISYIKNNLKRLEVRYPNDEYYAKIEPAIKQSGLATTTFIKQAVEEKIERDGLRG